MSNMRHWDRPSSRYIDELLAGEDGPRGKISTCAGWPRWWPTCIASSPRGGVFMYPRDKREPDKPGKLRLMYEANPMSFIVRAGRRRRDQRPPAHSRCAPRQVA